MQSHLVSQIVIVRGLAPCTASAVSCKGAHYERLDGMDELRVVAMTTCMTSHQLCSDGGGVLGCLSFFFLLLPICTLIMDEMPLK